MRDRNGDEVSVLVFIERVIAEQEKAYGQRFSASQEAVKQAREGMERIFMEHRIAHDAKHTADQEALAQARAVIDQRLAGMNEFRAEIEKDRNQFLRAETFQTKLEALEKHIDNIESRTRELATKSEVAQAAGRASALERTIGNYVEEGVPGRLKALEAFRNRAIGVGSILILAAGAVGALIDRLLGGG